MSLFKELKRRNVLRVAAAYIVTAWLVIQVVAEILPPFGFGDEAIRFVIIAVAFGFIPVIVLAWAFAWTPQGLRKEADVDRERGIPFQSGKKFDRIVIVILVVAVSYFALDKFMLNPAVDRVANNSIAVIPFVNLSAGPEQAFFADGVAEEVLNLLAKIPQLRVTSRSSSFTFRGEDLDIPEIAERLNVAHILEGSVRRAGNRIRITAQLIEANGDTHLWSETYDRDLDDVFAIQDEIAGQIVENLHIKLVGPMPIARRTDPVALALTIQAKQVVYASFLDNYESGPAERMVALLDEALAIDPEYTEAMAWYTYANWLMVNEGSISADEEQRRFDEIAARALALEPEQAMILQAMAWDEVYKNADPERAAGLYERALRSAPNDSEVLRHVGRFAYQLERFDESHPLLERAVELDPLCTSCLYYLSRGYMVAGKLEEAEDARRRFLLLGGVGGYFHYATIKLLQGDAQSALDIFEDREKIDDIQGSFGRAMALHSLGRYAESDSLLDDLINQWGETYPEMVADVYAWKNNKDAAFEWLDRSMSLPKDPQIGHFNAVGQLVDPIYQSLHGDPRWEDHREKVGMRSDRVAAIEIDLSIPE